jgi:hypothetical protein
VRNERVEAKQGRPGYSRFSWVSRCNRLLIVFVPFVFFVLALSACDAPPARAEPAAAAAVSWRPLGTWSGDGDRQSDSFDVVTGAMRLRWHTAGGSDAAQGRFRVSLYSAISGRPLQVIVDRKGPGADTAYVEDEPRVSYLVIESDRLDWTATLEEAVR